MNRCHPADQATQLKRHVCTSPTCCAAKAAAIIDARMARGRAPDRGFGPGYLVLPLIGLLAAMGQVAQLLWHTQ